MDQSGAGRGVPAVAEHDSLEQTRALLYEVFPIDRFSDSRYLSWFYRDNPVASAVEINRYENDRPIAHIGGIPQFYHCKSRRVQGVFPLNIAVSKLARGRGMMTEISQDCFEAALQRFGDGILVGVPNASSTPGYTGRLGFRFLRPLPVRVLLPVWPSAERIHSQQVTSAYLSSAAFRELADDLDFEPGPAWSHAWTREVFEWRLRAPHTTYAIHASAKVVLVTCAVKQNGVPLCVVVKSFARRGQRGAAGNAVAARACRFHAALAAIYAGFSDSVRFSGVPLPDRFKPAPLNLIVRSLRPGFVNEHEFEFDTFEFFDFDPF